MITNALTIDVEDYFQVHAFSDVIKRENWSIFESRVEKNTYRILDFLDSIEVRRSEVRSQRSGSTDLGHQNNQDNLNNLINPIKPSNPFNPNNPSNPESSNQIRATFFILGWIAERYPDLVREIHARGHEIACHGYAHQVIFNQTKEEFTGDVSRAKSILEDFIGKEVIGYRAPTYSITKRTMWALEILYDLGFKYDSSIFPIRHDVYGFPDAPRFPFFISFQKNGNLRFKNLKFIIESSDNGFALDSSSNLLGITEFPITSIRILNHNIPAAGGGYFRLFPYFLSKTMLKQINNREKKPFIFYIHPWEIDPEIPRIENARAFSKFRTYVNLDKTMARLKRLIADFRFTCLADFLSFSKQ